MGDKSPKKPQAKTPGSTLKEKRAVKKAKRGGQGTTSVIPHRPSH